MATHGVLSGPAIDRLKNSAIDRVVLTNTAAAAAGEAARQDRGAVGGADHRRRPRRRVRGHVRVSEIFGGENQALSRRTPRSPGSGS